jgi:hypothetical protein
MTLPKTSKMFWRVQGICLFSVLGEPSISVGARSTKLKKASDNCTVDITHQYRVT